MIDVGNQNPLEWLSEILWPDGSATIRPIEADDPAHKDSTRWWASPSATHPQILIPTAGPAARRAVRRYHDGFSPMKRMRSLAAETSMRVPSLSERALGGRQVGVVASDVAFDGEPGGGVIAGLSELLKIPDLQIAVSLSHPKSNRKPVLQLLDAEGRLHGWAKVAWNDWTESLVANEARWLEPRPLPPLVSPALLHDVEIVGRRVVVTSGFSARRLPARRPDRLPSLAALHQVAALGSNSTGSILGTAWARSVADVLAVASVAEATTVESVVRAAVDHRFRLGAWHGDLTPWNMMTAGKTCQLIDWEFAADEVPLGFDLCHFHTQVGAEMKGLSADAALAYSARLAPQGLSKLGIDPANQIWIFRLYLVELVRRTLALRASGRDTDEVAQGAAALRRLTHVSRNLASKPRSLTTVA